MTVTIVGASKLGLSLARALRARRHRVVHHGRRSGLPKAPIATPLLVIATRDGEIRKLAVELAGAHKVSSRTAVVHTSGGLGPDELEPLRGVTAGIGQAHPLLSFASADAPPRWAGALLLLRGDPSAVRRMRALARALGMRPRSWEIDVALYHAAAGLLANGSAALAALSMNLLRAAGAPPNETARALGPLLRSVGDNVERLGMPAALSGPVRRGDVETVERHLAAIARVSEEALDVYRAIGVAQVALSRALGEASPRDLERLSRLFARSSRTLTSAPAGGARGPLKTAEGPPTKTKARA